MTDLIHFQRALFLLGFASHRTEPSRRSQEAGDSLLRRDEELCAGSSNRTSAVEMKESRNAICFVWDKNWPGLRASVNTAARAQSILP